MTTENCEEMASTASMMDDVARTKGAIRVALMAISCSGGPAKMMNELHLASKVGELAELTSERDAQAFVKQAIEDMNAIFDNLLAFFNGAKITITVGGGQ